VAFTHRAVHGLAAVDRPGLPRGPVRARSPVDDTRPRDLRWRSPPGSRRCPRQALRPGVRARRGEPTDRLARANGVGCHPARSRARAPGRAGWQVGAVPRAMRHPVAAGRSRHLRSMLRPPWRSSDATGRPDRPTCSGGTLPTRGAWSPGTYAPLVGSDRPSECPGSLRPVPPFRPGDDVSCEFCGQRVRVRAPPLGGLHDPWRGSADARIASHSYVKEPQAVSPGSPRRAR
jgi:hypothetical protein